MSVKISYIKHMPDAQAIVLLEQALGCVLPKDYLDFVANFNGGQPQVNSFLIGLGGNESGVNEFIELGRVVEEMELGGFGVLQGFIPFAFAEGGNYVCIEVATGSVFFWDHEIEVGQGGLVKIADDIPKFLESMKPFDKSKIKLKSDQVKSAWIDPDFLDEL